MAPSTPNPPARGAAATTSRQWLKARTGSSNPSWSQMGVRTDASLSLLGRHAQAAVNTEDLAGDHAGIVAGEEHGHAGEIVGLQGLLHGAAGDEVVLHLLGDDLLRGVGHGDPRGD